MFGEGQTNREYRNVYLNVSSSQPDLTYGAIADGSYKSTMIEEKLFKVSMNLYTPRCTTLCDVITNLCTRWILCEISSGSIEHAFFS